jgi:hypothetical protein
MWLETTVLDFREERTTYLVDPVLAPQLPGEAVAKVLVTAITRHGQLFLWPIKLPDEHGRLDDWNAAALEAAQRARTKRLCVSPNIPAGTYNVREASGRFTDPVWPEVTLEALLSMAFKDRLIDNLEHSVLKRLRGEF